MTAGAQGKEIIPEAVLEEIGPRADTVWTPATASSYSKPSRRKLSGVGGRVAIVDGCRTPFSKAGTDLEDMDVVSGPGEHRPVQSSDGAGPENRIALFDHRDWFG